jgi:hypothetical protein
MATKDELLAELRGTVSREELAKLVKEMKAAAAKTPPDWKKMERTCPKCGKKGTIDPDFGVRVVRGVERHQSWCKECRANTDYTKKPRVYKQR